MINNSKTKKNIDWFIEKLPETYQDFSCRINLAIDEYLKTHTSPYSYNNLLKELYGVFPVTLWPYLQERCIDQQLLYDDSNNIIQSVWPSGNSPKEKMAYYEWRFTQASASTISNVLLRNNFTNICCLGTPSIAIQLSKAHQTPQFTLFDINSNAISCAFKGLDISKNCIQYDVNDDLDACFCNKYDVAIINPPWYYDYYTVFLLRCLELLSSEKRTVIMPLLPLLCKKNAFHEMIDLFSLLESCGCDSIESLGNVDYLTPHFEKAVFENNHIHPPINNWRYSELVKLTFSTVAIQDQINTARSKMQRITDYVCWREFTSNDNRVILQNKELIQLLYYKKLIFLNEPLNTISRRTRRANRIIYWDTDQNIVLRACTERGDMNGS